MRPATVLILGLASAMTSGCMTSHRLPTGVTADGETYQEVVVNHEVLPLFKDVKAVSTVVPVIDVRRSPPGVVEIDALVRKNGTVEAAMVRNELVSEDLGRSALQAVQQWKFPVKTVKGEPIRYLAHTRIRYRVKMEFGPGGLGDFSGAVIGWTEIE